MDTLKKTFMATACVAAITLGATTAQAADMDVTDSNMNFYVSVFGGAAFPDSYKNSLIAGGGTRFNYTTKFDTGFIIGGAIGVDDFLMENLRSEVEVSYYKFKPKSYKSAIFTGINPTGHLSSVNVLANLWYDIDLGMAVTPYLGGGAGIGFVDSKLTVANGAGAQWSGSDAGFAYQLGAGFKYDFSETLALDVGYRFRGVLDAKFNSRIAGFRTTDGNVYAHTVQAGISFKLPPM